MPHHHLVGQASSVFRGACVFYHHNHNVIRRFKRFLPSSILGKAATDRVSLWRDSGRAVHGRRGRRPKRHGYTSSVGAAGGRALSSAVTDRGSSSKNALMNEIYESGSLISRFIRRLYKFAGELPLVRNRLHKIIRLTPSRLFQMLECEDWYLSGYEF